MPEMRGERFCLLLLQLHASRAVARGFTAGPCEMAPASPTQRHTVPLAHPAPAHNDSKRASIRPPIPLNTRPQARTGKQVQKQTPHIKTHPHLLGVLVSRLLLGHQRHHLGLGVQPLVPARGGWGGGGAGKWYRRQVRPERAAPRAPGRLTWAACQKLAAIQERQPLTFGDSAKRADTANRHVRGAPLSPPCVLQARCTRPPPCTAPWRTCTGQRRPCPAASGAAR